MLIWLHQYAITEKLLFEFVFLGIVVLKQDNRANNFVSYSEQRQNEQYYFRPYVCQLMEEAKEIIEKTCMP